MTNQFKKPCFHCREMVWPGQGELSKVDGQWRVTHPHCSKDAMNKASNKEDIRIEFPSRGTTYYKETYGVYKYDVWPGYSVLAGQQRRTYLEEFNTLDEAKAKYADAEVVDHSCFTPTILSPIEPDWFDPMDAGEEW